MASKKKLNGIATLNFVLEEAQRRKITLVKFIRDAVRKANADLAASGRAPFKDERHPEFHDDIRTHAEELELFVRKGSLGAPGFELWPCVLDHARGPKVNIRSQQPGHTAA